MTRQKGETKGYTKHALQLILSAVHFLLLHWPLNEKCIRMN